MTVRVYITHSLSFSNAFCNISDQTEGEVWLYNVSMSQQSLVTLKLYTIQYTVSTFTLIQTDQAVSWLFTTKTDRETQTVSVISRQET